MLTLLFSPFIPHLIATSPLSAITVTQRRSIRDIQPSNQFQLTGLCVSSSYWASDSAVLGHPAPDACPKTPGGVPQLTVARPVIVDSIS